MTQEDWQDLRNKIYGVAGAVILLLIMVGFIDAAQGDFWKAITEQALELVGQAIALVTTIMAYLKSRPSKVTTIELPSNVIKTVVTHTGAVYAGPAHAVRTGVRLTGTPSEQ